MNKQIIDAHIHLDLYKKNDRELILKDMDTHQIKALISVSYHLKSAKITLKLAQEHTQIKPAFGFHPEQDLPENDEIEKLLQFIKENNQEMIAFGEVGLPYYLRRENARVSLEPYVELLEIFIQQAAHYDKPLVLHAIYEDAPLVCDLLEKYSFEKAHFHWFKGDKKTIERMSANGYFISVTPDILYEKEIRELVNQYPLSQLMVETDGPWKFEGPFKGQMTHPKMIHQTIQEIAFIKNVDIQMVYQTVYQNTNQFYHL